MFTRVVEVITTSGKKREVADTIRGRVLPILKNQPGFVDEIVLVSETEPNRILALSFWKTKEDAERYHRDEYPTINGLAHLIEACSRDQNLRRG